MQFIKNKKQKGFTLIEMLVSVALFSIVLVITMGSIITITDSNKKARSLMSVMNNLNFAVDSMTRSIKLGDNVSVSSGGDCVSTSQIDYNAVSPSNPFARTSVTYCYDSTNKKITKQVGTGATLDLTSPDVIVDYLKFVESGTAAGTQPRVVIKIEGTVKVSEKISSNFTIQTTVSQRKLNL